MKAKLLSRENYFKYFGLTENETGCGVEQEPESKEYYVWVQTFLPKSFFDLTHPAFNRFILNPIVDSLPEKIQVKFELFGIGSLDGEETFIFKPWVLNVDNPMLYQLIENFHLFVSDILFYNLISRNIFLDNLDINNFSKIRVLQNIPINNFQRFGLDRNIPKINRSQKAEIIKIEHPNSFEISSFYKEHGDELTPELENKYFREIYNFWFAIQTPEKKLIGYIRLYFLSNAFTGGVSIEYIVDKNFRNKGYATEAVALMLNYLEEYSFAIEVGAQVNDANTFSKKLLQNLNFKEKSTNPYDRDNFIISLLDKLETLEEDFEIDNVEISVLDYFVEKYSRYFNQ